MNSIAVSMSAAAVALSLWGCASPSIRRLDPAFAETYRPAMKFRFEPGVTDPVVLNQVVPGDIIAFSADDARSDFSAAFAAALSQVSHVAIVYPFYGGKLRVLSADSERGVYIDTVENCIKGRSFYDFAFPEGLLDLKRINEFAERAYHLGRLDYDWSAIFGFHTNITPNTIQEVGDEYTCSTAVAAALHYAGLSLDRAWKGIVTPGDIIFSEARRNLNGPAARAGPARDTGRAAAKREAER